MVLKDDRPLPWRVGNKIPHNIYDAKGTCIGHTHREEDARRIVEAVNGSQ